MGWTRERSSADGLVRFTAYYRDVRGRTRSAGTYSSEKLADKAWQRAEARIAEGRLFDLKRGRQTFETYVLTEWLPRHIIEASTFEAYHYQIHRHLLPWFGPIRMVDIMPTDVRDWIRSLRDSGVTPANIRHLKAILSAIFTTALNDQVTFVHPCKGVKTPTVARKILRIITPEQFDQLHSSLRDTATQLLVETGIETGLRWGELTELRVRDFDSGTQMLTIGRAVVQVNPRFHPTGGRFLVKEYPKDGEFRRFNVTRQLSRKLEDHMGSHDLGDDDLLFSVELCQLVRSSPIDQPQPAQLGFTDPTPDGRQYLHGTLSAYSAGGCHCVHCRRAYAVYRAKRRSEGRDQPRRPRSEVDTDGHIPRDWFRLRVWQPAAEQAGLGLRVRMHDLRHAHASWLLAGGADLQVVKERLGHASITTTEKYLHTLPDADETALAAFELTRNHVGPSGGSQSVIPP